MPLVKLFSAAFIGLEAIPVEVEIDLTEKVGFLRIVGLPDLAVKESKDRVSHAIKNTGFSTEAISCMVHLAPAEIKKVGAFYDLPIAVGILHGLKAFRSREAENYLLGGELGLTGEIRPITGALSLSLLAKKLGKKGVILPYANAKEAALVTDIKVMAFQSLKQIISFFNEGKLPNVPVEKIEFSPTHGHIDMSAIHGQFHAKRALEIAAAGKHNVLMKGPPGTGKTLLSKAFVSLLPPLSFQEALEVTNIYSLSGNGGELRQMRPFRAPHHTISYAGMVGGGTYPKPGEVSLAHNGVLFLDELPEFSRTTLEVLRQPLEDKVITVSRASSKLTFPTDFICIAAMNPCPCGYLGHPDKTCTDSQTQISHYLRKISGPLLDRIDIHLDIPPIAYHDLTSKRMEETSEQIRHRVQKARDRIKNVKRDLNATCNQLMKEAFDAMGISARAFQRILNVAQTIAALDDKEAIAEAHLIEAISYRPQ